MSHIKNARFTPDAGGHTPAPGDCHLPRPGGPREAGSPHPAAGLAEIVRIYGIRHWTGQSYKQVKDQLG